MRKKTRSIKEGIFSRELHKHPFIVPVVTLIALSFITMFAYVALGGQNVGSSKAHVVQLSADGDKQTVPTHARSVGDFLSRAKMTLHEGDIVEPARETEIDSDDFRINVYRAKPVTIVDGKNRIQALSAATTPRSIAAQAGVEVYPEDDINQVAPTNILKEQVIGTQLVIDRAVPVNLNLYGTPVTIRTRANTVDELLKEKNIVLSGGDSVQPSVATALSSDLQVFVTRRGTKIKTVEEAIDFKTEYVEDPNLSFGTVAVRQQGSKGRRLVTYQIELKNDKEVGRRIIQQVQAQEPVPQIIARGKAIYIPADKSQLMAQAGIKESDYPYANHIITRESGWCPTKWQGQIGYCPPYYEPIHSPDSGFGYGLCQSTPGSKMASAGSDWQTNPITQLRWCSGYSQRYGGWAGAYEFWLANHWW